MQVLFSNRVPLLSKQWQKCVFSHPNPFVKRCVVVHGPAMKDWLVRQVLESAKDNACIGIKWIYYSQLVPTLFSLFPAQGETAIFPTRYDWAWAIETELNSPTSRPFPGLEPEEKRIAFSKQLGAVFFDYSRYGYVPQDCPWQKNLWEQILASHPNWKILSEEKTRFQNKPKQSFALHLFSLPHLDSLEREILRTIAKQLDVFIYQFSPCAHFWTDLQSDRQSARWQATLYKKGVSERILDDWESLAWDRNILLANLGQVGRRMAQALHDITSQAEERYQMPQDLHQEPKYAEFLFETISLEPSSAPSTLLTRVQADLLTLRTPQADTIEKEPFPSIQFHKTPSQKREVEIAFQQILALMHAKKHIQPVDVVLMAPDITDYQPWIEAVFGNENSPISAQLIDLQAPFANLLLQGVSLLLSLTKGRWDQEAVFAIWQHPYFQQKWGFDRDKLLRLRKLAAQVGIVWGVDASHRKEILKRYHCSEIPEQSEGGTWKQGLEELLRSLASIDPFDQLEPVSFTEAPLLGECLYWITHLYENLQPLTDNTRFTLAQWKSFFLERIETIFLIDEAKEELKEVDAFFSFLTTGQATDRFSFASIEPDLIERLYSASLSYRDTQAQAVRCCSFLPMRTIPARVVILLGMEEESFPRKNAPIPSFHLASSKKQLDRPLAAEWDRYLFLEALTSCTDFFLISWRQFDEEQNKSLHPSPIVEELRRYLEKGYTLQGESIVEAYTFVHPRNSFDPAYFLSEGRLVNYSQEDFALAQSKEETCLSSFFCAHVALKKKQQWIDLSQWSSLAKHPIRYYFQKVLGMTFPEQKEQRDWEPFLLDPLDRYALRMASLRLSFPILRATIEKRGMLAKGLFEEVSWKRMDQESTKMRQYLSVEGVVHTDRSVIFQKGVDRPSQMLGGDWLLPPLPAGEGFIVGRISAMTERGKWVMGRKEWRKVASAWPEWLLLLAANKRYPEMDMTDLLFPLQQTAVNTPSVDIESCLQSFFFYWQQAQQKPSPLLPHWIPLFLEKEGETLYEVLSQSLMDPFVNVTDPYVQAAFSHPIPLSELSFWREMATQVFGPLYQAWRQREE